MELTKLQTKRINKFKKKLEKANREGRYIYRYNIRCYMLWYNNEIPICQINDEFLLKCSGLNWFNKINKYFGKDKVQEFKKALTEKLELETLFRQIEEVEKPRRLALNFEINPEYNEREELIKKLKE